MLPVFNSLVRMIKIDTSSMISISKDLRQISVIQNLPRMAQTKQGFGALKIICPLASTQLAFEKPNTQISVERTKSGDFSVEMDELQQEASQPYYAIAVTSMWKVPPKPPASDN